MAENPTQELVTFDDLQRKLKYLFFEGDTGAAKYLVESYGVERLSQIPQEKYPEIMERARRLLNE